MTGEQKTDPLHNAGLQQEAEPEESSPEESSSSTHVWEGHPPSGERPNWLVRFLDFVYPTMKADTTDVEQTLAKWKEQIDERVQAASEKTTEQQHLDLGLGFNKEGLRVEIPEGGLRVEIPEGMEDDSEVIDVNVPRDANVPWEVCPSSLQLFILPGTVHVSKRQGPSEED